MTTRNNITLGTVIQGTHRPQDLIPAFLAEVAPEHGWWNSKDAACLLESLLDILNDHAPDGWYFGAHPRDSSDFGFWPGLDLFED